VSARALVVNAVGNDDSLGARASSPAVRLAAAPNALVVGGCEPDAATWKATEATSGFRVTGRDVVLPHLCATTMGETGGAVLYPFPARRDRGGYDWYAGSGSSLSAPIVAAVCAIVWSVQPDLSAAQVCDAVLAASRPLAPGGRFHRPGSEPRIPEGSNEAPHPGMRRVVLDRAIEEAAKTSEIRWAERRKALEHAS
jgi:hypothetical protein